ncbi:aspartyl protease family protein [Oceaniferula spumae]
MKILPLLTLTLASLNPASAQQAQPAPQQKQQHAYHKLELKKASTGRHFLAEIEIEGKKAPFIIDSGASDGIIVTKKLAESLGKKLTQAGDAKAIAGTGKTFKATFDSIKVSTALKLKDHQVTVTDLPPHLNLSTDGEPIGGLIGYGFLKGTRALVSYSEKQIFFPSPTLPVDLNKKRCIRGGGWALTFNSQAASLPFVTLHINDKPYSFLLDTGAGADVLSLEIAEKLGLKTTETKHKVVGGSKGKQTNLRASRVPNVQFGEQFTAPAYDFLVIPALPKLRLPEGAPPLAGILGARFLQATDAVIDFGANAVLISGKKTDDQITSLFKKFIPDANEASLAQALKATKALQTKAKATANNKRKRSYIDLRKLTVDSTDEEIRAVAIASGREATPQVIAQIRRQLKLIKGGSGKGKVALSFKPGMTEAEVRAMLKEAGVPATDERVKGIMAKLKAAKPAAPLALKITEGTHKLSLTANPKGKNHWTIPATINGQPANLLLDSGAGKTVLNSESENKLRLDLKKSSLQSGGLSGMSSTSLTTVKSFQIGEATAPNQELRVINLHSNYGHDGLLGWDFLSAANAVFDTATGTLHYRANAPFKKEEPTLRENLTPTDLKREDEHTILQVTINGKPANLILDTGASGTLLKPSAAERLGLPVLDSKGSLTGVGGKSTAKLGITLADKVNIGPASLNNVAIIVSKIGAAKIGKNEKIDGILGADVLFALKPVIDFGNNRIHLPTGEFSMHLYSAQGSPALGSQENFDKAIKDGTFIAASRIKQVALHKAGQQKEGAPAGTRAIDITFTIGQVLSGDKSLKGKEVTLHYHLPEFDGLNTDIAHFINRSTNLLLTGFPDTPAKRASLFNSVWVPGQFVGQQIKSLPKATE